MKTFSIASIVLAAVVTAVPLTRRGGNTTSYSSGDTANDVVNGVCAPLTVIFARGTTETGNIGADVGPQLFSQIIQQHGSNVALQGVDYPATWAENVHLGHEGGPQMAALITQALQQCPATKVTAAGYSQGAMVLHSAMKQDGIKSGMVQAAVAFGDPFDGVIPGTISAANFKEFCGQGDELCLHQQLSENVTTHTHYGEVDGAQAAQFLIAHMKSGGGSDLEGEIIDGIVRKS